MTLQEAPSRSAVRAPDPPAPRHVAVIMDGNGRWANERGMPRLAGHKAGTENFQRVLETFRRAGVDYVTLYAFSTENWSRPSAEVSGLLELLAAIIASTVDDLHRNGVRIRHLGELDRLPRGLADAIRGAVERTRENDGLELCVAFDYGGRAEIVRAARRIVAAGTDPEDVTEELLRANMYLPDVPDPDMIVRTAGEQRLSNFLIWQAAYSEYYHTPVFWPDFGAEEAERALAEYKRRRRRFGALPGG